MGAEGVDLSWVDILDLNNQVFFLAAQVLFFEIWEGCLDLIVGWFVRGESEDSYRNGIKASIFLIHFFKQNIYNIYIWLLFWIHSDWKKQKSNLNV